MNTQNIHHFPLNLALFLMFGFLCVLPFSSLYFFGVEKSQPVLGTKSSVVDNVTFNQVTPQNAIEFTYSLSPFEDKQIKVLGNKVFLKKSFDGVQLNILNGVLYIKNLTPNSYLVEGVVY